MAIQTATAFWEGGLEKGKGLMVLGSGHFDEPYSFSSRFGDGKGTSPEELLGAAHSGSISMALVQEVTRAGFSQVRIETCAKVYLAHVEKEYNIKSLLLNIEAYIPGITIEKFIECINNAKNKCPVSKVLLNIEFMLKVKLVN